MDNLQSLQFYIRAATPRDITVAALMKNLGKSFEKGVFL